MYGGMESGDAKKMKQLEDENRKLKHVVCRGGVPEERATRLQADGIGTIDASLSGAESGAGQRTANPLERAGGPAHAVRVSPADGDAGAGRDAGQPQARVSTVHLQIVDYKTPKLDSRVGTRFAPCNCVPTLAN